MGLVECAVSDGIAGLRSGDDQSYKRTVAASRSLSIVQSIRKRFLGNRCINGKDRCVQSSEHAGCQLPD